MTLIVSVVLSKLTKGLENEDTRASKDTLKKLDATLLLPPLKCQVVNFQMICKTKIDYIEGTLLSKK